MAMPSHHPLFFADPVYYCNIAIQNGSRLHGSTTGYISFASHKPAASSISEAEDDGSFNGQGIGNKHILDHRDGTGRGSDAAQNVNGRMECQRGRLSSQRKPGREADLLAQIRHPCTLQLQHPALEFQYLWN